MSAQDIVAHQIKPGQVLNPKGINQYTYRADFENAISRFLKDPAELVTSPVPEESSVLRRAECLLCGLCGVDVFVQQGFYAHEQCIEQIQSSDLTRGEAIALISIRRALAGDEKVLPAVLDRLWPKVSKHELEASVSGHVEVTGADEWAALAGSLGGLKPGAPDNSAGNGKSNGSSGDPS